MATEHRYTDQRTGSGRSAPFFIILVSLIVLTALLLSLGTVYSAERKTVLLVAMIFIGISGLFAVRDVKPYLLFAMVFVTSTSIDFFFNRVESVNFHATSGLYFHIIFFPIIVLSFIHIGGTLTGSKRFALRDTGWIALVIFVIFTVLSLRQSTQPEYTLYELYSLLFCVLLYLLLSNTIERRKEVLAIGLAIAAVVLFQGLIAAAQYVKGSELGLRLLGEAETLTVDTSLGTGVPRASGTMGYPNTLALFLDMMLPVVAGMALITRKLILKAFFALSLLFGLVASVVTVSRAGLAVALVSVGLVTIYWGFRKRVLIVVLLTFALVTSLIFAGILLTENPIKERLFQQGDDSALSRIPMMEVAQSMIAANLFGGVGLNNYTDVAPRYDSTSIRISSVFPYPVHNTPLLILAEIGLLGFLGFSVFFISRIAKGFSLARDKNKDYSILGFSIGIGLTLFMIHTLVDYTYITSNFTFWLMCGLVTGLYRLRRREARV